MAKFQTGDHVIINEIDNPEFHGLCGVVIIPTMGDNRYALMVLDTPVENCGKPVYDWACRKSTLVLDQGVPRSELTPEQLSYL